MLTNELNLPQPFVDAAKSDHNYRPRRYSVTELLGGTCEAVLKRRHAGEAKEDVSDRLWAILGTAVHKVLETAQAGPEQHQEQKIVVPIDVDGATYSLSGIFDLYNEATETVTDYKVSSVWKCMVGDFEDWRMQTLMYCWMLVQKGYGASHGEIVAMMRDHNKRKAKTEKDYPSHPVITPRWDFSYADIIMIGRYIADWFLEVTIQESLPDDELKPCDERERWHKADKWAVVRDGLKRAKRVLDSKEEAERYINEIKDGASYHVEFREGDDTRCQSYCSVAQFCPYGKKFFQDS